MPSGARVTVHSEGLQNQQWAPVLVVQFMRLALADKTLCWAVCGQCTVAFAAQLPPNGLVVYTGMVMTEEGKEKKVGCGAVHKMESACSQAAVVAGLEGRILRP